MAVKQTVPDVTTDYAREGTMIHCRTLGLPSHLAYAGAVLKLYECEFYKKG